MSPHICGVPSPLEYPIFVRGDSALGAAGRVGVLMIQVILGGYAVFTAVATVAFISLSLVSKRLEAEALEPVEELEPGIGDRRIDFDPGAAD